MGYYCVYQCPKCKRYTFGKCGIKYKVCPYCNTRFKPEKIKIVKGAKEARTAVQELNSMHSKMFVSSYKATDKEFLPSGIPVIDEALSGGFLQGELTLLYGPPASGKSLFCFFISAQALNMGYRVIFLDSANTFSVDIVKKFLNNYLDLKNFLLFQFLSFNDERGFIKNSLERIIADQKSVIIWDTVISNIYGTFDVDINMIILIDEVLPLIRKKISAHNSIAFFTTNVISVFNKNDFKPIGGRFLSVFSDNILRLNSKKNEIVIEKRHNIDMTENPKRIRFSLKELLRGLDEY